MKKFYLILRYVIVAIVCFVMWNSRNLKDKFEEEIKGYESKIGELQEDIDSLYEANDSLEVQMDSLNVEVELSDKKITELNLNLDDLKIKNTELSSTVDSFSNDELQKFFTERYGHLKDSVN
jgi:peptidoglycan hydrolase CwlO-like protein